MTLGLQAGTLFGGRQEDRERHPVIVRLRWTLRDIKLKRWVEPSWEFGERREAGVP